MNQRVGCLIVPLFALAARLRSEPDLRGEAVAVVEGNGNAARVIAATRRARKEKICAGLTLTQARAILPRLIARGRDAECERTAQEALLEIAERFSPRIEDAGDGVAYLDLTGMERWAEAALGASGGEPPGKTSGEERLANEMVRAGEMVGLPVRVGIASSKLAARVAAELPKSPTIVAAGAELSFLAPLPLARLAPEIDAAETLARWGIASIGDLARLPEAEIASRLGEAGRNLHWAARGIDPRPLTPRQLPPEFREGMDLEWPLVSLEPFLFVANAALDRLSKRLESQGLACRRIELTLKLEPDGFHSRAIDLPAPTRDVKTLLTLIRLDLEKQPPGAPVAGFTFVAHPDRPRRAQLSLFGPAALSPDRLATTIARLASMLGEERVGMPVAVDGHTPERFSVHPYEPPPPPEMRRRPRRSRGLLAVRVLRPPIAVDVAMDGDRIRSISADRSTAGPDTRQKQPKIDGPVRVASGPWSVEEAWWSDAPVGREYWDIEVTGGMVRLYREGGGWFVDGVYD